MFPICAAAAWTARLKEEYAVLIQFLKGNKARDADWCTIAATDKRGCSWAGRCWGFHEGLRYELPAEYPAAPPSIALPDLDGSTAKMYRGGVICTSVHFEPLWRRAASTYGLAHALALGLAPWMAVELPALAEAGAIKPA